MTRPDPSEWFALPADEAAGRAAAAMLAMAGEYATHFSRQGFPAAALSENGPMRYVNSIRDGGAGAQAPSGIWFVSNCGSLRLGVAADGKAMVADLGMGKFRVSDLGDRSVVMLTNEGALRAVAGELGTAYRPAGLVLAELVAEVSDALGRWAKDGTTQAQLREMDPAAARDAVVADMGRFTRTDGVYVPVVFKHDADVAVFHDRWETVPAGTVTVAYRDGWNGRWKFYVPSRQGFADMRKSDVRFLMGEPE